MTNPAEHVEEIEVEPVPEPDEPEDGVIDPSDTYTEGQS
jgi:hypothetical protein